MDDNIGHPVHHGLECTRLLPELSPFFKKRLAWSYDPTTQESVVSVAEDLMTTESTKGIGRTSDRNVPIAPADYELTVYVHYPRHHRSYLTTDRPLNLSIFEYLFYQTPLLSKSPCWTVSSLAWAIGVAVDTEIPREKWNHIRTDIESFSASFDERADWFWSVYSQVRDIVSIEDGEEAPKLYWGDLVGYSGHARVLDVSRNDVERLLYLEVLFEA